MTKWRFDRGRLVIFFIVMALYCSAGYWLFLHPEYTKYDPTAIVHNKDGTLTYIRSVCEDDPIFGSYGRPTNCQVFIEDVPPAYYIHQWLIKHQPKMFWIGNIGLLFWIWLSWDKIKSWRDWLNKNMDAEDRRLLEDKIKNDKKQNKKQRNRK